MADEPDDAAALAWLSEVERALPPGADRGAPFAHGLWPLVESAWTEQLAPPDVIARELDAAAGEHLRVGLLKRLTEVAAPALAEEMNRGIPFGQRFIVSISPEPDDPPRNRYVTFCRRLAESGVAITRESHPLLPGLVDTAIRQWAESTREMLDRVHADRDELERVLGVPRDAVLTSVHDAAGDRHNDGRAVCILGFGALRIAYKPRDVRLEELYASVAVLVSRELPGEPLVAPAVLARSDAEGTRYGYVAFVDGDEDPWAADGDASGRAAFYRHAGRTLAVLYALAATDAHTENLVIHRHQPVLVDAETLLTTPSIPASASVLDVGMLPGWMWLDGFQRAIDVSALGVLSPADQPRVGTAWRSINTDAMNRGRVDPTLPAATDGEPDNEAARTLLENVEGIVDGFTEGYRALVRARDDLLALLASARGLGHRLVHRPTYVYAVLLRQSLEPSAMASSEARTAVIDGLERAYRTAESDAIRPLLAAETAAVARLDVPYFMSPVEGGQTRWHPDGILDGWPEGDGLEHALSRIRHLDEDDLARQVALIRGSVSARAFRMGSRETTGTTVPAVSSSSARGSAGACVTAVITSAIGSRDTATWMGLSLLPDGIRANLQPMGLGLYDGRLGLAAGLHAWADTLDGDDDDGGEMRAWADTALRPVLEVLTSADGAVRRQLVGAMGPGMNGAGGYLRGIDVLATAGHIAPEERDAAIDGILDSITAEGIARDRVVDHMAGAAGLVAPLCRLVAETGDARAAVLLRAAADTIVDRQDQESGGWPGISPGVQLTGLAHGASGMALALAEAAVALGAPEYLTAMRRGLAFEAALFDPDARNWPDLRPGSRSAGTGFMQGWCAGAPGIGLARLRILELLPDDVDAAQWRAELDVAARSTADGPLLRGDHVCCGNLGRAVILRRIAAVTGDDQWAGSARVITDAVLARAGDSLPRSALGVTRAELAVPGLMMGLTGVALALAGDSPVDWVPLVLL